LTTRTFTQDQLEAIAAALGDTDLGLSNTEIEFLFTSSKLVDPGPSTKRIRIYNAFATSQNERHDRLHVLAFIRQAMAPARYVRSPDRYEPLRSNLNRALAFCGLEVTQAGALQSSQRVQTLPDAEIKVPTFAPEFDSRIWEKVMGRCLSGNPLYSLRKPSL
jgi:hypothetical protein